MLKMFSGLMAYMIGRKRRCASKVTNPMPRCASNPVPRRQVEIVINPGVPAMNAVLVADTDTDLEFGFVRKATIVLDALTEEASVEVVWAELDPKHHDSNNMVPHGTNFPRKLKCGPQRAGGDHLCLHTEVCDLKSFRVREDVVDRDAISHTLPLRSGETWHATDEVNRPA